MMRQVISSSLNLRRVVVIAAAGLFVLGATQLKDAPVASLPEFGPPTVEVQTEALGLSAVEVEQLITTPMEQDLLNGVAFLDVIRSESVPGLSSIELIFEPGTDLFHARQVVQERLSQAHALPQVSKPPQMLQPLSSTNRVMMIKLSSKDVSLIDMSVLTRWTIRPRLMGIPGVANVSVWGQRDLQLQVQVDPKRLRKAGVTLQQVIESSGNALWSSPLSFLEASTPGTGGFIDTPNQRLGIQHLQPIKTAKELAQVTIQDSANRLRLGDVAQVVQSHQPLIGDAVFADGPGLLLVVEKFPGADTLKVTDELEAALDSLRPGLTGIQADSTIYRPATSIKRSMSNLTIAILVGFGLALLVLGLVFFDWRRVAIVAIGVPLSVTAAFLILRLTGTTFNALTLGGLVMALGIVIDDAVTGVEHAAERLRSRRGSDGAPPAARIVLDAALHTGGPMAYALIIILLAVIPLVALEGIAGALLPPLVLAFALAIAVSMLVALTVTPALTLILFSNKELPHRESPVTRRLESTYERSLARTIRSPVPVLLCLALVIAGAAAVPFFKRSVIPSFKETDFLVDVDAIPGTSLPEMDRISSRLAAELRTIPGVRNVGAQVGRAVLGDQVVGVSSGELWVSIDSDTNYDRTITAVRETIRGYAGIDADVLTHSQERLNEVLTRVDAPVHVRLYGTDLSVLRAKAEEVRGAMSGIKGIVDPTTEIDVSEPTLEVEVNLAAAERHGIKPGDVRRAAAALLSGIEVGSLFEEQKIFEVVVWGAPQIRQSLTSVRDLQIDTPGGGTVRLGEVADVRLRPNPKVIVHESVSRSIDVIAGVRGRDLGDVTKDVERRLARISFPLEYHAELLGDHTKHQALQNRTVGLAVAAAIGIFLLLQVFFGSWRLASAMFLALPSALSGGAIALLASGRVVTAGTIVGFIAVFGIALRHSIMMIAHARELHRDAGERSAQLVVQAARERFVPTMSATLATAALFLPAVFSGPIAGLEIIQPMAVVLLGGLISSAVLSLFVVPFLYLAFGTRSEVDPASELLAPSEPEPDPLVVTTRVIVLDPEPAPTTGISTLAVDTPDIPKET